MFPFLIKYNKNVGTFQSTISKPRVKNYIPIVSSFFILLYKHFFIKIELWQNIKYFLKLENFYATGLNFFRQFSWSLLSSLSCLNFFSTNNSRLFFLTNLQNQTQEQALGHFYKMLRRQAAMLIEGLYCFKNLR